jgi:hypothetical protein
VVNKPNINIKINIVNLSTWPTDKILVCLDNLSKYLNENKINVEFDYKLDELLIKSITDLLRDNYSVKTLNVLLSYLVNFQDLYPQNRLLILGESLNTVNPYGDSLDPLVSAIKELDEKVIWHETVHLLGAKDHYYIKTEIKYQPEIGYISKMPIPECTDKIKCLMQWDAKYGELFCSKALDEMTSFLLAEQKDAD